MKEFSVLMSIYYNEKPEFFQEAMKSIWDNQTLKPSEIVLVEDGELTDELCQLISHWQTKLGTVLKRVSLEQNVGLAEALNSGLNECQYELVARMDTDDIALSNRFEEQMNFMKKHPEVAVISSYIEEWNEDFSEKLYTKKLPSGYNELLLFAKKRCPLAHPGVMYRKSSVLAVGGYPDFRKAQDYALWSLMLVKGYQMANVSQVLLKMRAGKELFSRRSWSYFKIELEMLKYQRSIGFLSYIEFIKNTFLRFVLRLVPNVIKNFIYKTLR